VADLRRLLADIAPLRESADFRRLWIGTTLSTVGSALTLFAVMLQVFLITGSSAAVGGIGLAAAVPALALGLFGGALVDSADRRTLVLYTQGAMMLVSAGLAFQALAGNTHVWLLYALQALSSCVNSVNAPARRTFMPRLLPAEQIPAGAALSMLTMHISFLGGPVLAGLLVPLGGVKLCYLIDVVSFTASLYGVFRLPAMRPEGDATVRAGRGVLAGVRFLGRSRVLTGVLLADITATLFAMPVALYPAVNAERFGGSPRTLGLLSAGLAIGGVIGTVFSGPLTRVRRPGRGMLISCSVWGAALFGFGVVHSFAATLAMLVIAGVADVISVVLRSTIIQVATPDAYRGRVNAAEIMVGGNVPQLGNFRAGVVAELTSPSVSAGLGGVLAVLGAAGIALAMPAVVRYRTDGADTASEPADGAVSETTAETVV
jgi:MFS family permease